MKIVSYFKALSDDTRLRLVHLFLHYELNVNEIVAIMGMGQSRISRHLKILVDTCLLTFRRDGLWTFYSAVNQGEAHDFIESIKYLFHMDSIYAKDLEHAARMLERRSEEATRFFDAIAEDWEKLKREIFGDIPLNKMILDILPVLDNMVDIMVDMGCGTGDLLDALKTKANYLIGVDKSPRMLETAYRRFASDGDHIQLRLGQLEHLPLRDGEADLAVINMVLHHLPEPIKAIKEAHRVLKKDTPFIIVDLQQHNQEIMRERYSDRWLGFSTEELEKWLDSCGFFINKTSYFDLKKNLKGFIIISIKR